MTKKVSIYKQICQEHIKICKLFPDFLLSRFIVEENIKLEDSKGWLDTLKTFRERLELDNHVMCDDEETREILEEGLKIHRVIAQEQLYGKD